MKKRKRTGGHHRELSPALTRTTETELAVLCDILVVLPRNYLNIKITESTHLLEMTSRHLQQVACTQVFPAKRPKLTAVAWNTREDFRAPPSLPAPHFPNCCYSCFWPDLSQWWPRCGGGRLGFHSLSERPEGGQLRLFADLLHLWPVGRVRREAARVQHGFVSLEGPSDCTNAIWGGVFFLGRSCS